MGSTMITITIPQKVTKGTELVIIPKWEYEKLINSRAILEIPLTAADKRDIARARRNRSAGNYLTIDELKRKLGFTS